MLPQLSLILGGASSGKSAFAENLVTNQNGRYVYLATAQAFDEEMTAKITRHKSDRGTGWTTIEAPLDIPAAINDIRETDIVLLDCATLWLSNHILADSDLVVEQNRLLTALNNCAAPVVVVSNELGQGIVPDNAMARQFRDAQGKLNQRLAAESTLVVMVTAGLPIVLKGQLP